MGSLALLMHVVRLMTGNTCPLGIFERGCAVTFLAGHRRVGAKQRKLRQIMIEIDFLDPAFLAVTLVALLAFLTLMHIILSVAGVTILGCLVLIKIARVAVHTGNFLVLAFERVLRVLIVIEFNLAPGFRRMAIMAFLTVQALVLVFKLVTRKAVRLEILVVDVLTFVAFTTAHRLMPTL